MASLALTFGDAGFDISTFDNAGFDAPGPQLLAISESVAPIENQVLLEAFSIAEAKLLAYVDILLAAFATSPTISKSPTFTLYEDGARFDFGKFDAAEFDNEGAVSFSDVYSSVSGIGFSENDSFSISDFFIVKRFTIISEALAIAEAILKNVSIILTLDGTGFDNAVFDGSLFDLNTLGFGDNLSNSQILPTKLESFGLLDTISLVAGKLLLEYFSFIYRDILVYYPLSEGVGQTVTNRGPIEYTDTFENGGITWVPGPVADINAIRSTQASGTALRVDMPSTLLDEFSYMFWFNNVLADSTVIATRTGSGGPWVGVTGSGQVQFEIQQNSVNDTTISSPSNYKDGNWHFVVATYKQSTKAMKLYVDGALVATGTASTGVTINSDRVTLLVGEGSAIGTSDLDVALPAVFTTELTQADIDILYNDGSPVVDAAMLNAVTTSKSETLSIIDAVVKVFGEYLVSSFSVLDTKLANTTRLLLDDVRFGREHVTNGKAEGDNTNFSEFIYDPSDSYDEVGGMFKVTSGSVTRFTDELIVVDPEREYDASYAIKLLDDNGQVNTWRHYGGFTCVDADGSHILPQTVLYVLGSETTLAAPLNPGDSTITLTDASNWYNGASGHQRNINFYPYTNSLGETYPDYTYSRLSSHFLADFNSNGAWAQSGISGNVITLRSNWTGPAYAAGAKVANSYSGSTYNYTMASNAFIPDEWTVFSGTIGGFAPPGTSPADKFRQGTKYVRCMWLLNRNGTGNATTAIDAVSMRVAGSGELTKGVATTKSETFAITELVTRVAAMLRQGSFTTADAISTAADFIYLIAESLGITALISKGMFLDLIGGQRNFDEATYGGPYQGILFNETFDSITAIIRTVALTIIELVSKSITLDAFTESLSIVEAITKLVSILLVAGQTNFDSSQYGGHYYGINFADDTQRVFGRLLSEAMSIVGSVLLQAGKNLFESFTITELLSKDIVKSFLAETLGFSDFYASTIAKFVAELLSIADAISKGVTTKFDESMSMLDDISKLVTIILTAGQRNFDESAYGEHYHGVRFSESIDSVFGKELVAAFNLLESKFAVVRKQLSESLNVSPQHLMKQFLLLIAGQLSYDVGTYGNQYYGIGISDAKSIGYFRNLQEAFAMVGAMLTKQDFVVLFDALLSLTDLFSSQRTMNMFANASIVDLVEPIFNKVLDEDFFFSELFASGLLLTDSIDIDDLYDAYYRLLRQILKRKRFYFDVQYLHSTPDRDISSATFENIDPNRDMFGTLFDKQAPDRNMNDWGL